MDFAPAPATGVTDPAMVTLVISRSPAETTASSGWVQVPEPDVVADAVYETQKPIIPLLIYQFQSSQKMFDHCLVLTITKSNIFETNI